MSHRVTLTAVVTAVGLLAAGCGLTSSASEGDETVRVYSGRHYDLEQAFEQFYEATGTQVEFLFGNDAELRNRIDEEGEGTQADVYMTVDAANLHLAAEEGLFQPAESSELSDAVPASLRDPQNRWFGLSMRARTIMYNPNAVDPDELSTYAALGESTWQDRVCMRNSTNVYTQSLIASLIANHGRQRAREIVAGWVDNGTKILGNDIRILEQIAADGGCDVGITNHYYLARLMEDNPDIAVEPFWANQSSSGTHVNVSGAGVTRYADDPGLATDLLEWLATDGQKAFVEGNHEYPVNPAVEPGPTISEWSDFERDSLNAARLGALNDEAVSLMAEVGYE